MTTLNGIILLAVYLISIIIQAVTYYLGLNNLIHTDQVNGIVYCAFSMMAIATLLSLAKSRS
jgi:hypothetical protein